MKAMFTGMAGMEWNHFYTGVICTVSNCRAVYFYKKKTAE
jgi:hypothetical protein